MRGTLALSCTVWVMSVPIMDQAVAYEGLYQKSQAIKEINREIKHSLLRGVSDAMIVAVANLANVAVSVRTLIHCYGLETDCYLTYKVYGRIIP